MFERLTYKAKNGLFALHKGGLPQNVQEAFARLAAYEDSGLSPEQVQELAKAKAEGRLVVLPVKVGDTVHVIVDSVDIPYTKQEKVIAIELWGKNRTMTLFIRTPYGLFDFGKTVFLTRKAAEEALRKEQGHEQ